MTDIDPIDPDLAGLSRPAPARATPFLIEGGPRWIRGIECRSGFSVGRGGRSVTSVDAPGLGTAASVLLFPGVARRDFTAGHGSVVETLLTASSVPLVVAEWRVASGRLPGRIVLGSTATGAEVVRNDGSRIVIAHGDHHVGLAVSSDAGFAEVERDGPDGLRVVVEPGGATRLSIALAFGRPGDVDRGLDAARHANAHAVRAAAGPEGGLLLRTGVSEIDDGVRWLRSRLAGRIERCAEAEDVDAAAVLGLGLAALGVGDRESAARLVSPAADAHHTLLAARFASVFGDVRTASTLAATWASGEDAGTTPAGALTRLALKELAEALHGAVDARTLTALRGLAAGPAAASPDETRADLRPGPRERRLPMKGSGQSHEGLFDDWLVGLVEGDPPATPPHHPVRAIVEARTATARFMTDPDEAWMAWRRLLTGPIDRASSPTHGETYEVLWDSDDPSIELDGASLTAELLIAVAHGLLGLRPDAPTGRIRIAPRIPSHLTRFEAEGIGLGSSSLGLRYEKRKGVLRYELVPEVASVPPLVVLEPSVSGLVRSIRVDGARADLESRTLHGRTVTPVQLPLDGVRTLEIETSNEGSE